MCLHCWFNSHLNRSWIPVSELYTQVVCVSVCCVCLSVCLLWIDVCPVASDNDVERFVDRGVYGEWPVQGQQRSQVGIIWGQGHQLLTRSSLNSLSLPDRYFIESFKSHIVGSMSCFIIVRHSSDLKTLKKSKIFFLKGRQVYAMKFISSIFVLPGLHFRFHCLEMKRGRVLSRSAWNDYVEVLTDNERGLLVE